MFELVFLTGARAGQVVPVTKTLLAGRSPECSLEVPDPNTSRQHSRFVYDGSWCNEGLSTSWNGHWTVRGEHGSTSWDGTSTPYVDAPTATNTRTSDATAVVCAVPEEIAGSLAEFIHSLRTGEVPSGDIHSNIWTLAMVEAAVASSTAGARVRMQPLFEAAFQAALANAESAAVATSLVSWGGPLQPAGAHKDSSALDQRADPTYCTDVR